MINPYSPPTEIEHSEQTAMSAPAAGAVLTSTLLIAVGTAFFLLRGLRVSFLYSGVFGAVAGVVFSLVAFGIRPFRNKARSSVLMVASLLFLLLTVPTIIARYQRNIEVKKAVERLREMQREQSRP
jgi:4-amino-4-deoxy-L-arabinose transferase-like glycosyltransferase